MSTMRPKARTTTIEPSVCARPQAAPIDNVARNWGRAASATALGTERTSAAAALWPAVRRGVREVSADPNPDTYSLGILLGSVATDTFVDGRPIFSGIAPAWSSNLIRPGERPRSVLQGSWQMMHVYLPGPFLRGLTDQEEVAGTGAVEFLSPNWTYDPAIGQVGAALRNEMRSIAPYGNLRLDALTLELGIRLLRAYSNRGGTQSGETLAISGGLAPWQLRRATDAMEDNLQRDLRLADLAGLAGLSPGHFCRAFRRSTGLPPFAWLRVRRIERAKQLLAGSGRSLAEIALEVGFAAQPQFTTAFRRETGASPGAWRRHHLA